MIRNGSSVHMIQRLLFGSGLFTCMSIFYTHRVSFEAVETDLEDARWNEDHIVSFMEHHPSRAYFTKFFVEGGFRSGMEVGVADGRFSEHFLKDNIQVSKLRWTMVEPFPNKELVGRYDPKTGEGKWNDTGLLNGVVHSFHQLLSTDEKLLATIADGSYDFVYLDGDHSYKGVKEEIKVFWPKVRKGGVLAGHDYCNFGESSLPCIGCGSVPKCGAYTEYGLALGKQNSRRGRSHNKNAIVKAVQEWMMEQNNPNIKLHFTKENFTRESLAQDGMDYDLVITSTRTPSWFIVKN